MAPVAIETVWAATADDASVRLGSPVRTLVCRPFSRLLPKLAGQFDDSLTTTQIDRYGLTYGELKAISDYLREILQRLIG